MDDVFAPARLILPAQVRTMKLFPHLKKKPEIDLSTDAQSVPALPQRLAAVCACYGSSWEKENATVAELETRMAELLDKPRSILCHSGIIANTMAIEHHLRKGDKPKDKPIIVASSDTHVASVERPALLHNTGCGYLNIPDQTEKGIAKLLFEQVEPTPGCKVATAEITWNRRMGAIPCMDNIKAYTKWAKNHGMATHLDGVRLLDTAVSMDVEPAELCRDFDTVIVGFAKGLRCQSGNVLSGSEENIAAVETLMKQRGMFIRQGGPVAAQCLYGLNHWKEWIKENHVKARDLAERLNAIDGIYVDLESLRTNIMYVHIIDSAINAEKLKARLEEKGIRWDRYKTGDDNSFDTEGYCRVVMHASITRRDIEYVERAVKEIAAACKADQAA